MLIAALLSSSGLVAEAASARAAPQGAANITIPSGTLNDALVALAIQTRSSIGLPGNVPNKRVGAIRGAMSVDEALRRLLKNTGLVAQRTGVQAWKIVAAKPVPAPPKPAQRPVTPPLPSQPSAPEPDIVVTATKTGDTIRSLPLSAHVVTSEALVSSGAVPTTGAIAHLEDGLVLSNLGPGRNKAFLRGISDSPFNGVSQSTVATEIDDARVTFNAPDPELRLVDIDRIELLEGPQGPTHGTGALGGVYRILPRTARLDETTGALSAGLSAVAHGGIGASGSAMLNIPLSADRVGLRLVGYGEREPGWIERDSSNGHDSNTSRMVGGRANLRWQPAPEWTVDLSGIVQMLHVNDSQYVDAGSDRYERTGALAEPHDNDFMNGRLAVHGKLGEADLVSTTSWTSHEVDTALDASAAAGLFGQTGTLLFEDSRQYDVRSQEVRLSGGSHIRWMGGLSWLRATTKLDATISPAAGGDINVGELRQKNSEVAAFGQLSIPLGAEVRLDLGSRIFHTSTEDEIVGPAGPARRLTRRDNFSPSASLGWTIDGRNFVYTRIASAYRPAGLSPFAPSGQEDFESDELQSFEVGGRFRPIDDRLRLNATAYFANWSHIQSDYVLPNGLVATRNSGTGVIYGVETDMTWSNGMIELSSGLNLQHSRLEKPEPGLPLRDDLSLPVVPTVKAHLGAGLAGQLGKGDFRVGARLSFVGPARLSLDPALNRRIKDRTTVAMDAGYASGGWAFALRVDNLFNSRADTFGYGNPFSISTTRQITPQCPRSVGVTITTTW